MSSGEGFEEFVAIVEHGSVTAGAEALGIPRATLSRRLARLEARLGVRLLHRTTRRLTVTPPGEALFERAQRLVRAAQAAEAEVRRLDGVPRGLLRVQVPAETHPPLLSRWVGDYLRAWPEVQIEVLATSRRVDLVGDGFDVALHAGEPDDPSLVARVLARDWWVAVASPQYLAARGTPRSVADLADHDCIIGSREAGMLERHWPLRTGGRVAVSGPLTANQMGLRLQAAEDHLGIALVVERLVVRQLRKGSLEHVLPEVIGKRERLSLLYAERSYLDPKVRTFIDHISREIARVRAERDAEVEAR